MTVGEIVFPQATEFAQIGQAQPLLVFEHEFTIGVRFEVSATAPAGPINVPARLRYQACDDRLCYAPVTADVLWTLTVARDGAARPTGHAEVFDRIAFGTRPRAGELLPSAASVRPVNTSDSGIGLLDQFSIAASTGDCITRTISFSSFETRNPA